MEQVLPEAACGLFHVLRDPGLEEALPRHIIWVLIKIKVSEAATIADQPRINRDPNGVNRGRVLSYATLFYAKNRRNIATYHSI